MCEVELSLLRRRIAAQRRENIILQCEIQRMADLIRQKNFYIEMAMKAMEEALEERKTSEEQSSQEPRNETTLIGLDYRNRTLSFSIKLPRMVSDTLLRWRRLRSSAA